jgi:hypothetical protein
MSTLEVNSLIHLDASSNNLDLDSSGNATVNGNMTATQFYGGGGNLTGVGVDGIVSTANATAITIDSNENVGIGVTPEISTNTTGLYVGSRTAVVNWGNGSYFPHNAYESGNSWKYRDTAAAGMYSRNNNGDHVFEVGPSGSADTAISFTNALTINNAGQVSTPNRFTMSGTGSGPGLFMGGWQIFDNASESYGPANSLAFYKGGSRFAVSPSGGITFNGDTAAANTLNDYEEGTFTPTFTDGNGFSTSSSASNNGTYTKIGNTVTISCSFYLDSSVGSISLGDRVQINGFPFNLNNDSNTDGSFSFGWNYNDGTVVTGRCMPSGGAGCRVVINAIYGSGVRNGGRFQISGHYYTDS